MSVFNDFPSLAKLEKLFQDFQGPARALYKLKYDMIRKNKTLENTLTCHSSNHSLQHTENSCMWALF